MSQQSGKSGASNSGGGRGLLIGGAIAVVCMAGTAWFLWPSPGDTRPEPGVGALVPKVLCSSCGFCADAKSVELVGDAAVAPALGPGYKCPKCNKPTLYTNPYVCKKCATPFLGQPDGAGNFVGKCPKCGTVN